nr:mucin-2-like [Procambarus clarkii]
MATEVQHRQVYSYGNGPSCQETKGFTPGNFSVEVTIYDDTSENMIISSSRDCILTVLPVARETSKCSLGTSVTVQLPEPTSVTVQLPEPTSATVQLPEPTSVTVQLPEPTSVTVQLPEPTSVTVQLPEPT